MIYRFPFPKPRQHSTAMNMCAGGRDNIISHWISLKSARSSRL